MTRPKKLIWNLLPVQRSVITVSAKVCWEGGGGFRSRGHRGRSWFYESTGAALKIMYERRAAALWEGRTNTSTARHGYYFAIFWPGPGRSPRCQQCVHIFIFFPRCWFTMLRMLLVEFGGWEWALLGKGFGKLGNQNKGVQTRSHSYILWFITNFY